MSGMLLLLLLLLLLHLRLLLPIRLFLSSPASSGARSPASDVQSPFSGAHVQLPPTLVVGVLALRKELVHSCLREVNQPAGPALPDRHKWELASTVSPIAHVPL